MKIVSCDLRLYERGVHRLNKKNRISVFGLVGGLCVLTGCATQSPVTSGMMLRYQKTKTAISRDDPEYETTLQIRWLGTACYSIQLGDTILFTDPFLTHQSLKRVILGSNLKSDASGVSNRLSSVPAPQAIFVGHSHYDHMLDLPQCLKQPGWGDVPVYGSWSTRNILCGYGCGISNNWRPVLTNTSWQLVAPGIRYQAVTATHARQLPLLPLLYSGRVESCRPSKKWSAGKFKVGDTYAFMFELSNQKATNTIYFNGAAHPRQEGFPLADAPTTDVAILCVPSWKRAQGYPMNIIQRLRPVHIVASHYDDFFQVNGKSIKAVALANLEGFLEHAQHSVNYNGFEDILVPSVGSVLRFPEKRAE